MKIIVEKKTLTRIPRFYIDLKKKKRERIYPVCIRTLIFNVIPQCADYQSNTCEPIKINSKKNKQQSHDHELIKI